MADLLVRVEGQFAVGADHVAGRWLAEPFAAAGAAQPPGLHALLELMQLETSQEAFDGQDQTVVEVLRMIQAVLVCEQGVESGANLDQTAAGLVFAGQAVDLKAEHQADVAQGNFRQEPGEIIAAGGRRAGAALIAVEDANALGGPTPGAGVLLQVGLDLSGFAVALHLLGMRLTDIDDGPTFEMVSEDLGGPLGGYAFSGSHRPPPLGRWRWRRAGVAAASASAGPARSAAPRASGVASVASSGRRGQPSAWAGGRWLSQLGSGHGWRSSLRARRCWHHRASSKRAAAHTTGRGEGVTRVVVCLVDPEAQARGHKPDTQARSASERT